MCAWVLVYPTCRSPQYECAASFGAVIASERPKFNISSLVVLADDEIAVVTEIPPICSAPRYSNPRFFLLGCTALPPLTPRSAASISWPARLVSAMADSVNCQPSVRTISHRISLNSRTSRKLERKLANFRVKDEIMRWSARLRRQVTPGVRTPPPPLPPPRH